MKNINKQEKSKKLYHNKNSCNIPLCYSSFDNLQNAVANIIYAEGEQIKKIISLSDDCSCITNINDLVNKNIYQLTIFENSIYDILKYHCPVSCTPQNPICNCDVDGGVF